MRQTVKLVHFRKVDDVRATRNVAVSGLHSALGEERFYVRFNVGAVHDTHVCGGDMAASVDEVGNRECLNRLALRDPVVAHQYRVINLVDFDEGVDEVPGLSRPFQIFIENVHGNSNHYQAPVGVGVVNFDERGNFFDAAPALGGPKV